MRAHRVLGFGASSFLNFQIINVKSVLTDTLEQRILCTLFHLFSTATVREKDMLPPPFHRAWLKVTHIYHIVNNWKIWH